MAMVKRKYSQTKTGKKLSVKLLCARYVYSSHIDKIFYYTVLKQRDGLIHKGTFESTFRPVGKQEISSDKSWREAF